MTDMKIRKRKRANKQLEWQTVGKVYTREILMMRGEKRKAV